MNDDSAENKAMKIKIMIAQTGQKAKANIWSKKIGSLPKLPANIGGLFLNILIFSIGCVFFGQIYSLGLLLIFLNLQIKWAIEDSKKK